MRCKKKRKGEIVLASNNTEGLAGLIEYCGFP